MACYQPIRAFQRDPGGRVILLPARGPRGEPSNLELPCGKCLGCQQTRANHWAERCKHHASQYLNNSFLTLTYNDYWQPDDRNVQPRDLQLFLKRLRKRLHRVLAGQTQQKPPRDPRNLILSDPRRPLRYFACGEYGETTGRPHYHLLLFNADFAGQQIGASHGNQLRINDHIAACWTDPRTGSSYGNHTVGTATAGAVAGYIAKYVLKSHRYNSLNNPICDRDGVANPNWIRPPFVRMSKGIGNEWLTKYHSDLARGYYTDGHGRKQAIPRYYKRKLKEAYKHTAMILEEYQHIYTQQTKDSDKNSEARRRDAQIIHEQKYRNERRGL